MILGLTLVAGCASSNNEQIDLNSVEHLVQLKNPADQPYKSSRVYIDSVKRISTNNQTGLLISGTFPDACTNLERVTHQVRNDSLHIQFNAWRNPKLMCAQVLTPFSYFYPELSRDQLSTHSAVIINDSSYSF